MGCSGAEVTTASRLTPFTPFVNREPPTHHTERVVSFCVHASESDSPGEVSLPHHPNCPEGAVGEEESRWGGLKGWKAAAVGVCLAGSGGMLLDMPSTSRLMNRLASPRSRSSGSGSKAGGLNTISNTILCMAAALAVLSLCTFHRITTISGAAGPQGQGANQLLGSQVRSL